MNAMAWHPARGLCDPFGGADDLRAGLVRAVGEPTPRFGEDALRILRAYRFAAQLGFAIEPHTRTAAITAMPLVAHLSAERVRAEWEKLLCSSSPTMAFLPELVGAWKAVGLPVVLVCPPNGMQLVPNRAALRWAAFVYLTCVDMQRLFERLRFANRLANQVRALVGVLKGLLPDDALALKKQLAQTPPALLDEGLLLRGLLLGEHVEEQRASLAGILARGEPYLPVHLALRGKELVDMGYAGAACGRAQRALLDYVLCNPAQNTAACLRDYLARYPLKFL